MPSGREGNRVITKRNRAIRKRKEQGSQGEEEIIIIIMEIRSNNRVTMVKKKQGNCGKEVTGKSQMARKG